MDFNKLYRHIQSIDEGTQCGMGECGMTPLATVDQGTAQQPNSINMNVNMSAAGSGGIKDLINILRNIEKDVESDDSSIKLFGRDDPESKTIVIGDEYANSENSQTFPHSSVINPPSNDMHKPSNSRYNKTMASVSGNNPMTESLINRLSDLYFAVKNR